MIWIHSIIEVSFSASHKHTSPRETRWRLGDVRHKENISAQQSDLLKCQRVLIQNVWQSGALSITALTITSIWNGPSLDGLREHVSFVFYTPRHTENMQPDLRNVRNKIRLLIHKSWPKKAEKVNERLEEDKKWGEFYAFVSNNMRLAVRLQNPRLSEAPVSKFLIYCLKTCRIFHKPNGKLKNI